MTRKSILHSVRLDDDVWEAVKAMDRSLNQYLRETLLSPAYTINLPPDITEQEWNDYRAKKTTPAFKGQLLRQSEKKK